MTRLRQGGDDVLNLFLKPVAWSSGETFVRNVDSDPNVIFGNATVMDHHFDRSEGNSIGRIDNRRALLVPSATRHPCALAVDEWVAAALYTPHYPQ